MGVNHGSISLFQRSSRRPDLIIPRGGELETGTIDANAVETDSPTETKTTAATPGNTATAAALSPPLVGKVIAALTSAGKCYSQQLELKPILTKSYTAGLIFGLSDFFAQKLERSNDVNGASGKINWTRTLASTLVGLLYFGPAAHYWYEWIFRLLPATTLLSTLHKAFWGQVLFGPSFTCIFFATILLQSGDFSIKNWWEKIRNDLPGAWLAGIGYWPIVDLLSYSVIPVKWIPLFVNMASFIWTIYLSLVANKKAPPSS
jgi:protein Mpv17